MPESTEGQSEYRIGEFRLDLRQHVLFRGADIVPLAPKAFDTLAVLVSRPGQVVAKTELMQLVWPETFVEENNLTQCISVLRKALGDEVLIETVPRRGYRLIVPAAEGPAGPAAEAAQASQAGPVPVKQLARWVAAAAIVLACAVLAVVLIGKHRPSGAAGIDSVVVLPFVNLSGDPKDEFFADGLTEELTHELTRIQGLRVVARTTAFQFKNQAKDIRDIGRRLNVAAALEGSVRRQDVRIRVTAQLNNVADGYHFWSQTYDATTADLFAVQEDIARRIAERLKRNLAPTPVRTPTESVEAHTLYLQGLHLRNTTDPASVQKAIEYFEQALRADPNYAEPYAGMADCYAILAWSGAMPSKEAYTRAKAAAAKALALNETLSAAHTSSALVALMFDWDWNAAEREFTRAIALNPSDAQARHWYSHYLVVAGRLQDALTESKRALELDPLDQLVSAHMGWHFLEARQYAASVAASAKTLELDPHFGLALMQLTDAYEHLDQYENAVATTRRMDGGEEPALALERSWRDSGPRGYWQTRWKQAASRNSTDDYELARIHARLGERKEALDSLERAYAARSPGLIYLKHESYFDTLAQDRRFRALLKSMGLD